jgi:hypothetical protein
MYGLLSFRFLSVIRQTFWGLQYPSINLQVTPVRDTSATKVGSPRGQNGALYLVVAEAFVQRGQEASEVVHLLRAVHHEVTRIGQQAGRHRSKALSFPVRSA